MAVRFIGDICYEQIKGNYWYANYHGFKVVMDKSNGYINATKLCVDGGKSFYNWLALKRSKETMNYYLKKLNQPQSGEVFYPKHIQMHMKPASPGIQGDASGNANSTNNTILPSITITGGEDAAIRGTYIHPKLIHHIAMWIS